jgi:hypothetical protein
MIRGITSKRMRLNWERWQHGKKTNAYRVLVMKTR